MSCIYKQKLGTTSFNPEYGYYDENGLPCKSNQTNTMVNDFNKSNDTERPTYSLAEKGQFIQSSAAGLASLVNAFKGNPQQQWQQQQQFPQYQQNFADGGFRGDFDNSPPKNNTAMLIIVGLLIVGVIAYVMMQKKN